MHRALVCSGGLITRMRMDSQILQNADGRADLAQLLDYVTGPVAEIANTLQVWLLLHHAAVLQSISHLPCHSAAATCGLLLW